MSSAPIITHKTVPEELILAILREALRQPSQPVVALNVNVPNADPFDRDWRSTFTNQLPTGHLLAIARHAYFLENRIQLSFRQELPANHPAAPDHCPAWYCDVRSLQADLEITKANPINHKELFLNTFTRLQPVDMPKMQRFRFTIKLKIRTLDLESILLHAGLITVCPSLNLRSIFSTFSIKEIVKELQAMDLDEVTWQVDKCKVPNKPCGCPLIYSHLLLYLYGMGVKVVNGPEFVLVKFKERKMRESWCQN